MKRESGSGWLRIGVTLGSWALAVSVVQSTVGADIASGLREGEERIELRIRERHVPTSRTVHPTRTDEVSIEPWELVSV